MDLSAAARPVIEAVRAADAIEPRGAKTHRALGFPVPPEAVEISAPSGILRHDPDDLTVTTLAGTSFAELDAALAERGQFVPLDPFDPNATVGGTIASGLSGPRRLGYGPLRDHVLEINFVDAHGELLRGGGPTVKNVTGYDLVRLLVGSLGTLGVFVSVTLRCRPVPPARHWWSTSSSPNDVRDRAFGVVAVLSTRAQTYVRFEGDPADALAVASALEDVAEIDHIDLPTAACRGRISVSPHELGAVTAGLDRAIPDDLDWLGEWGIGTVHVAGDDVADLVAAREVAHRHGGWLLREQGAPDLDPFGVEPANAGLMRRVKYALDPADRFASGRFG